MSLGKTSHRLNSAPLVSGCCQIADNGRLTVQEPVPPLAAFNLVEDERIGVFVADRVEYLADIVQDAGCEAVEIGIEIEKRPVFELPQGIDK